MNFRVAILIALSVGGGTLSAADFGWRGPDGKPVADTPSQRSVNGFGGWLVVTPDADWEAKWDTPKENIPSFTTSDVVRRGQTLTILVFLANPRLDTRRHTQVSCDVRVTRPDKTLSINEHGISCFDGILGGDPAAVFLSNLVIKFVGEPKDPVGIWLVDVTLHDVNANIDVPLKATFELK